MAKDMEIHKLQVTGLEISSPEPSSSPRTAQPPADLDLEAGSGGWGGGALRSLIQESEQL